MDENAVLQASVEDLEQLGLTEKGHIICIKGFVMRSSIDASEERKNVLLDSIKSTSKERTIPMVKFSRGDKKVQFGWKHNNGSNFTQVRAKSGGGVREFIVEKNETLSKLKERALNLFFPAGTSKKFGCLKNLVVNLGDFSGDVLHDLTMSIENYIHSIKMSGRTRLYLLTEKKHWTTIQQDLDSEKDEDFIIPAFKKMKGKAVTDIVSTDDEEGNCVLLLVIVRAKLNPLHSGWFVSL